MAYKQDDPFGSKNPYAELSKWVLGLCVSVVLLLILVLYSINMKSNAALQKQLGDLENEIKNVESRLAARNSDLFKTMDTIRETRITTIEDRIGTRLQQTEKNVTENKVKQDTIEAVLKRTTGTANATKTKQDLMPNIYAKKVDIDSLVRKSMNKRFGPELDKKPVPTIKR